MVVSGGVSAWRCSRSYCKRAREWSKRAVGGPYRSEGRPYRGPLGSSTVSLMAAGFLIQSDGEAIPPRVRENASRSVSDENMREGWMGGTLTLHAPKVSIWISLVVHVLDNCDSIPFVKVCALVRTLWGHDHDVDPFPRWQLWATGKAVFHRVNEFDLVSRGFFPLIDPLVYSLVGIIHIRDSKF